MGRDPGISGSRDPGIKTLPMGDYLYIKVWMHNVLYEANIGQRRIEDTQLNSLDEWNVEYVIMLDCLY